MRHPLFGVGIFISKRFSVVGRIDSREHPGGDLDRSNRYQFKTIGKSLRAKKIRPLEPDYSVSRKQSPEGTGNLFLKYNSKVTEEILNKRQQQVLYDKKWIKFLKRTWLFRFIPFVEFALAAGSLATGNVNPDSDFDVIVGVRAGRIFTARFFSVLLFGLFGWRRRKLHSANVAVDQSRNSSRPSGRGSLSAATHKLANSQTANKVCLNHFVTEKSYRLSPPYDAYWKNLYQNLVPVFGATEKINEFFAANADWLSSRRIYLDDLRHVHRSSAWPKLLRERVLGGRLGDWLESVLRRIQIARIEKSLKKDPPGYKPRIKYNDEELEFHPDTLRTSQYR